MNELHAYCHSSGIIHFGSELPHKSLPIVRGPRVDVEQLIKSTAKPVYGGVLVTVPHMPEAQTVDAKIKALRAYRKQLMELVSAEQQRGRVIPVAITNV